MQHSQVVEGAEQPGLGKQLASFPPTFYVANTMEIFERMAWYGMFTPLALYIRDEKEKGGLGLKEEDAGTIIGIATFVLYLLPVATGALGDRFGYKKMLILAYAILTPAYFLLGYLDTYGSFLAGFLLVAVGAAVFKPVIVGTVARVASPQTSQLAFGIFYMMVNIGGFIGPTVSGWLRGPDAQGVSHWKLLFTSSAIFIAINFFWVLVFYKEPTTESRSANPRTLGKVLRDAVEVLGNPRFFLCFFGMLILFFSAGKHWITWTIAGYGALGWLIANLAVDLLFRAMPRGGSPDERMRSGSGRDRSAAPATLADSRPWILQPMKLSNWRFALYLLILSGFWTAFNQILGGVSLVSYVEDYVQTAPLSSALATTLNSVGLTQWGAKFSADATANAQWNPEQIANLDPLFIVFLQIPISLMVARMGRFPGMIIGIILAGIGIALPALNGGGAPHLFNSSIWIVVLGIFIFAIGEMMASPTSQEYIGSIAPKDKVALYMGYYFIAIALGNLFGNVLGGELYGRLARDMQRPDLMWLVYGGIAVLTSIALALYNVFALPRPSAARAA